MKSYNKGSILLLVIIVVLIVGGVAYVFLKKSPQKQQNVEDVNMPSDIYTGGIQPIKVKNSSSAAENVKKSSSSKVASVPKAGTTGGVAETAVNTGTIEQLDGDINAILNTSDPTSDLAEPDLDVDLGL